MSRGGGCCGESGAEARPPVEGDPGAEHGMVLEGSQADVGEQRVVHVGLDVLARRRLLLPDAEEAEELVEVVAAQGDDAAGDDGADRAERNEAAERESAASRGEGGG